MQMPPVFRLFEFLRFKKKGPALFRHFHLFFFYNATFVLNGGKIQQLLISGRQLHCLHKIHAQDFLN